MLLMKHLLPGSLTAIINLTMLFVHNIDKVSPNLETSSVPQPWHKRAPNVLINLQAGHDEQGNGIDTVVLEHLGIVLVEDLLEEDKGFLHIGLGSY